MSWVPVIAILFSVAQLTMAITADNRDDRRFSLLLSNLWTATAIILVYVT